MTRDEAGRARPPGAPQGPQRKKLPHDRPRWLRPKMTFSSLRCVARRAARTSFAIRELLAAFLIQSNSEIKTMFGTRTWSA